MTASGLTVRPSFRGFRQAYEPQLWIIVFPLALFAVASFVPGRVIAFAGRRSLVAAWVCLGAGARSPEGGTQSWLADSSAPSTACRAMTYNRSDSRLR